MNKPKELWILPEEMDHPEDNTFGIALREHPGQGPLLWQSKIFKVVPSELLDEANRKIEKYEETLKKIAKRPDLPNPERDADWKNCMKWASHEAREALKTTGGDE